VISGFLVLLVGVIQQKRRHARFSFLTLTDLLAMSLAITHAFGRIGCLAAGCCWGAVTQSGFGIHYGPGSFAYMELLKDPQWADVILKTQETPGMHPTQRYEAGVEFLIFGILFFMGWRQNKHLKGRVIGSASQDPETIRGEVAQAAVRSTECVSSSSEQVSSLKSGLANQALDAALAGLSALPKGDEPVSERGDGEAVVPASSALASKGSEADAGSAALQKEGDLADAKGKPGVSLDAKDVSASPKDNLKAPVETEASASETSSKRATLVDNVKVHPGRMTAIWFIGYGVWRIIVEMMRDDTERGYFFEQTIEPLNRLLDVDPNHVTILTTSQGIGIFMIMFGLVALILSYHREIR
jgi:prolipoprotein diacylglyceryltransferase